MAVIKSRIRGNGGQLARYLLSQGENEWVRIVDVDGDGQGGESDLKRLLKDMSLNEQLTRSKQGIYHTIIAPDEEASLRMKDEDWRIAADIIAEELGFSGQRRALVLHQKHGKIHAHLAMERYDHEKGKMIGIGHNFSKQDKARSRIEALLQHKPTPRRNPNRDEMKAALTALWKKTGSGKEFAHAARRQGYVISHGYGRIPYMVVDPAGRAFNLIRHLNGINTKEVRGRLNDVVLMKEKEAIAFARTQETRTSQRRRNEQAKADMNSNEPGKEKSAMAGLFEATKEQIAPQQKAAGAEGNAEMDFAERLAELRRQQKQASLKPRMK